MAEQSDFIKRPLSVEYVRGVLIKLADTLDKYENIIPQMMEMADELDEILPEEDEFEQILTVVKTLTKYSTTSPVMNELFENVRKDFWHGSNEDLPRHEGRYYVDLAASE